LGDTGERGFELLFRRADAQALWYLLTQEFPVAGYAAMDILRIEAGFILYCNECSIGATPIEMGLAQFAGEETDQNLSSEFKLACFTARHHECPVLWQHSKSNPPHPTRGEIVVISACFSRCPKRFSAWVISTQKMSPLGRL
jgi:aminomethyltransferase